MEITPDTVEVVHFLQYELSNIGIARSIRAKWLPCPRRGTYLRLNKWPFLKVLAQHRRTWRG